MKTLIAYYSLSGNNEYLAKAIQQKTGGDLLEVKAKRKRNWFLIFADVFLSRFPKIEKTNLNVRDYDRVILVAPIWIGKIASPLCTFIKQERKALNNFSFISFCGGGEGLDIKVEDHLQKLSSKVPHDLLLITISERIEPVEPKDTNRVMKYKMNEEDLHFFEKRINRFLELKSAEAA